MSKGWGGGNVGNRRDRKSEMRRKGQPGIIKEPGMYFFNEKRKSSTVSNAAYSLSNIRLKCSIHLAIGI